MFMETTFDKFITNDPKQKELFDKEYAEFLHSEKALENLKHTDTARNVSTLRARRDALVYH